MAVLYEGEVSTADIRVAEACGGAWEIWRTASVPEGATLPYWDIELALGIAVCPADLTVSGTAFLG